MISRACRVQVRPLRLCKARALSILMTLPRLCIAALLLLPLSASADDEASNTPRVFASRYGNCYAKSVPAEHYGQKGTTRIFMVDAGTDRLAHTHPWYAQQLFLECNAAAAGKPVAVAVARIGPWHRGRRATANDLAIAFYHGGKLVRQYSTLDIAGSPDNLSASMSHFRVFEHTDGYHWRSGNEYVFHARTTDGRHLAFDAASGERVALPAADAQVVPARR